MIWTPLAFRLAASTRATWPASLVCTTTVRPAVMAISSTKDQADPNQLHSFVTSKPTTCPRPYCSWRKSKTTISASLNGTDILVGNRMLWWKGHHEAASEVMVARVKVSC